MKTVRRLFTVGLLIGSYQVALAQDANIPEFNSEAEKTEWKATNPNHEAVKNKQNETKAVGNPELRQVTPASNTGVGRAEWRATNEAKSGNRPTKSTVRVKSTEQFSSEAEKKTWLKANPQPKKAVKAKKTVRVAKEERFSSDAEKKAWIEANPAEYEQMGGKVSSPETKATPNRKADAAVVGSQQVDTKVVVKKRVNNTSKALPADYKPASTETKKEKK